MSQIVERPRAISSGRLAALLAVGMTASTVMVPLVSVLAPFILDDLGMSRTQLGVVVAVTPLTGGILSPLAGRWTDRIDGFVFMRGVFALSIAVLLGVTLAPSFPWLLVSAAVAGALTATGNPVTNKLISDLLPVGRRGWVTGIKQSGLQIGMLVAGVALPPLALRFGWRVAALALGILPLVGLLSTRSTPPSRPAPADAERGSGSPGAIPGGWWLTGFAFLMGSTNSVVLGFLPLYVEEGLGFSASAAGGVIALVGVVALVGRVSWGRVAERAPRVSGALLVIAIVGTLGTSLIRFAPELGAPAVWIGAALVAASLIAWNGAGMLAVLSMAPAQDVGRFSGRVQLGFFIGLGASPVIFGTLVDRTNSYAIAWSCIVAMAALAVVVSLAWMWTER